MLCAAPRAVLDAEAQDVVSRLPQGGRGGPAREPGAHDDDGELAAVRRVHQLRLEPAAVPLFGIGPDGTLASSCREPAGAMRGAPFMIGPRRRTGTEEGRRPGAEQDREDLAECDDARRQSRAVQPQGFERAGEPVPQVETDDRHARRVERHPRGVPEHLAHEPVEVPAVFAVDDGGIPTRRTSSWRCARRRTRTSRSRSRSSCSTPRTCGCGRRLPV